MTASCFYPSHLLHSACRKHSASLFFTQPHWTAALSSGSFTQNEFLENATRTQRKKICRGGQGSWAANAFDLLARGEQHGYIRWHKAADGKRYIEPVGVEEIKHKAEMGAFLQNKTVRNRGSIGANRSTVIVLNEFSVYKQVFDLYTSKSFEN